MGKKFLLKTDNMSLKYLFDPPNLNSRKAKCLSFLSEYHFELKSPYITYDLVNLKHRQFYSPFHLCVLAQNGTC